MATLCEGDFQEQKEPGMSVARERFTRGSDLGAASRAGIREVASLTGQSRPELEVVLSATGRPTLAANPDVLAGVWRSHRISRQT